MTTAQFGCSCYGEVWWEINTAGLQQFVVKTDMKLDQTYSTIFWKIMSAVDTEDYSGLLEGN